MYTIKEINSQFNISRRMIQEYEGYELIKADARNKYGHLLYDYKTVETMKEIRFLQDIGMSLRQIKIYRDSNNKIKRKLLIEYRNQFKKRIDESIEILNRLDGIIKEEL
ncbi:MAG: MerR family transcriptional regulator [Solobacterium sp.]|nr:MerR family transcriptional regulator [Solobacterium sp.]MDY3092725.1 MerR family transcriptional regulator [Erysipelotrichaceae bacterium]